MVQCGFQGSSHCYQIFKTGLLFPINLEGCAAGLTHFIIRLYDFNELQMKYQIELK